MKYAIISDIHANLEALVATFEAVDRAGVDKVVCLGDIVGYGADPNECVDMVRKHCDVAILGNHDAVACGIDDAEGFNPIARQAIMWTREVLSEANAEFLRALPREGEMGDFIYVHGALSDPDKYITSTYAACEEFSLMGDADLCFFGHTHVALHYVLEGSRIAEGTDGELVLVAGCKYLVNPGSVGQPRDRDPRSAHIVYDSEGRLIERRRVEYDIERAHDKIVQAGLDPRLAVRLFFGL